MEILRFTSLRDDYPEEETLADGLVLRKSPQFKATYWDTLVDLEYELKRVGVDYAVLEIDAPARYISANGVIRTGTTPLSPRVRLSFEHPEIGLLQYPCGSFRSYDANVRAIYLTLKAQRAIERYGATRHGQQFAGWKALPPTNNQERYLANAFDAAEFVVELIDGVGDDVESIVRNEKYFQYCYREAAKRAHPDSGGNHDKFATLQQAKELLDEHFLAERAA